MGVTKDFGKLIIFKVQNLYFKGTKHLFFRSRRNPVI